MLFDNLYFQFSHISFFMNHFIFLSVFYFISACSFVVNAAEIIDNDNTTESTQFFHREPVIFMSEEVQQASGIKTLNVKKIKFKLGIISYGKAIDINPLLTIRNKYLSAVAQQSDSSARLSQVEKDISRLDNLHKNNIISSKKLQNKQSQWHSAKTLYDKSSYQKQLIFTESKLQWGDLLTQWATDNNSPQFDQLINGESTLLKVALSTNDSLSSNISSIHANTTDHKKTGFTASFVCALPQADALSQKPQYIFLTNSSKIKPNMGFTARIPQPDLNQTGTIIPESSLVWHLGQPFVFIKTSEEHFIHRNISHPIKTPSGYYIHDQILEEEKVVILGAQTLLSHEFRSQIPDEDD